MGSASRDFGLGKVANTALAVGTLGASQTIENVAHSVAGMNTPAQTAMNQAQVAAQQQASQAAALQTQIAQQPRVVQPDNFLAERASQLARLRLGILSTQSGAAGAPPPVLSSTSLQAGDPNRKRLLGQ